MSYGLPLPMLGGLVLVQTAVVIDIVNIGFWES
jgi:hypothetical protein